MRDDRARATLDRHATYIVAAYLAGAARSHKHMAARAPGTRTTTRGETVVLVAETMRSCSFLARTIGMYICVASPGEFGK